jgi:hypothetical protein
VNRAVPSRVTQLLATSFVGIVRRHRAVLDQQLDEIEHVARVHLRRVQRRPPAG